MIDFHTHVLPRIDDGSQSSEESLQLIETEVLQGIDTIVATPHFYAQKMNFDRFVELREKSRKRLEECLREKKVHNRPVLRMGAEVLYFDRMSEAEKLDSLCIEGTRQLLIEMPFCQWKESMKNELEKIIKKRNLHIILAHVDRYERYQKDTTIIEEILELPLTIQLNAEAYLGCWTRKKALAILKQYHNVVLGSDTHNMNHRKPNLGNAVKVIEKHMGKETLEQIDRTGRKLLAGERIK